MSQRPAPTVVRRYVAWLGRHRRTILATTAAIVAAAIYLAAYHLPLYADLSDLLPQDIPAIRDLHRLEARVVAKDAMVAVVGAEDPRAREAVATALIAQVSALDRELVARVQGDDRATRDFVRAHRYLYVPLADLERGERALASTSGAGLIDGRDLCPADSTAEWRCGLIDGRDLCPADSTAEWRCGLIDGRDLCPAGSTAEWRCGLIDGRDLCPAGSTAEWRCGLIDGRDLCPAGSTAEWRCGLIDGRDLCPAGSTAEWRCGLIDGRDLCPAGSTAEWRCGLIDGRDLCPAGSTAEWRCGLIDGRDLCPAGSTAEWRCGLIDGRDLCPAGSTAEWRCGLIDGRDLCPAGSTAEWRCGLIDGRDLCPAGSTAEWRCGLIDGRDLCPAGSTAEWRCGLIDGLLARARAADAALDRSAYVSADGHLQAIVIETAFRATDVARDRALQRQLDALAAPLRAAHPGVTIAFTGSNPATLIEHDSLVHGMLLSSLVTGGLVALVLLVHLRSPRVLALLVANITAATIVAFGIAAITVGHLNAATAFLGAIIAGNGINYGILLVARYQEERRAVAPAEAMATAIATTLQPTLVASLGAAIAYGALAATRFAGFADFAIIGGVGMLVCWLASFVVLPVLVLGFATSARAEASPVFGRAVVAAFGFCRPAIACAIAGAIALGSVAITAHYLAHDPFEYDLTRLRSDAPSALANRRWMKRVNDTLGRGLAGMARSTIIAVDDADQVPAVVAALAEARARDPIVGPVASILDAVPPDQDAKLRVLAKLRVELDEAARSANAAQRAKLAELRPPDDLRAFTVEDLPAELRAKLTERDGRVGYLIAVTAGGAFDEWNGHDLVRFASAIRELPLPGGRTVTTSGPGVIFADIITAIRRDGAVVTAVAALALVVMIVAVVGRNRRAVAVLASTALGSLAMIAVCAVVGLRINFLDFVALPITLGLGIDYAINIADRAERDDPRAALRSTGGSVLVCSLTTMIGYASLLVSSSVSIRGFGLASLIGEITCVIAALAVVPSLVALGRKPA